MKKQKYIFEEVIEEIKEMYLQGGDQVFYKEEGWCLYSLRLQSVRTKIFQIRKY